MKRIVVFLIVCVIMFTGTGCAFHTSSSTEDNIKLKTELENLKEKINGINTVYEKSLVTAINKYCQNYLSYEQKVDADNVQKIRNYITSDYYNILINQPFNEGNIKQGDYSQQTALHEIYYENISDSMNKNSTLSTVNVLSVCYQSVIADNNTNSCCIIYKFKMVYNNQWLIANVETVS